MRHLSRMMGIFVMVFSGAVLLAVAGTDWDAPGNPPVKHTLFVDQVIFTDIPDDGANGKSELFIQVIVSGLGLVEIIKQETLDLEDTGGIWHLGLEKVIGYECSPPRSLHVAYNIIEFDNGGSDVVVAMLFNAIRSMGVWYLLNPIAGAVSLGTGAMGSAMLPIINGHDSYGYGTIIIDPSEDEDGESIWPEYYETTSKTIKLKTLSGKDSGAILRLHLNITEEEEREECEFKQTAKVEDRKLLEELYEVVTKWFEKLLAKPKGKKDSYYGGYYGAMEKVANEQKAARLDRYQIVRLKKTYASMLLGRGSAEVFSLFKYAQLKGVSPSVLSGAWRELEGADFQAQRAIATENRSSRADYIKRALKRQLRAFKILGKALLQGTERSFGLMSPLDVAGAPLSYGNDQAVHADMGTFPAVFTVPSASSQTPFEPPLYLFVWFDYLAIKEHNDVTLLAAVSKGASDMQLQVSGLPEEALIRVEPMEGVPDYFWIEIGARVLPPGIYPLTVTARVGRESVSRETVIVIEGSG